MQIRWNNIIALGVIALSVTLGVRLAPQIRDAWDRSRFLSPLRTSDDRVFILCALGLVIVGVVTAIKLLVQSDRRNK